MLSRQRFTQFHDEGAGSHFVNPIEQAMAEGRADAKAGLPPRARPHGKGTKNRWRWYLNGYHVEKGRMRRLRLLAQLTLWAIEREEQRA